MVTIRDVAREADVSVATVSRVLNNPQAVRESTRRRVEEVIRRLNFRPDPTARRLSIGRTLTISVLMPFLTYPSFVERLRGIEAALSHSAYDLVVSNAESWAKRDAYFDTIIWERRYDGTILVGLPPTDQEAEAITRAQVPVALVDTSHPCLPSVDVDDVEGGRMAAAHLLERGHRRVAFLGDNDHELCRAASSERFTGFQERLAESGVPLLDDHIFWVPHSRRQARRVVEQILAMRPDLRPTGLFATSDTTALGVLDGLRQQNLRAPDDLAVIGFDDLEVAELYELTTIRQPLFQSGARAVECLLTHLESKEPPPPRRLLLPLTLVVRSTT